MDWRWRRGSARRCRARYVSLSPAPTASVPPPGALTRESEIGPAPKQRRKRGGVGEGVETAAQMKWGPALLPAPTAPSEGSAKSQNQVPGEPIPELRLTSSGVASHRPLPPKRSLATSTPVRQPKPRFCFVPPGLTEVKADRCSAALLGKTLNCVPLCFQRPESRLQPRRAVERSSLPAPLPGWPRDASEETSHCPPRRSDFWSPAASCFRCRLSDEAGTAVPITNAH